MPFTPEWSQTISALSAVVIGGSAALIAYRNYSTAKRKLELDLFKPRLEIYQETQNFLDLVISSENLPNAAQAAQFFDQIKAADRLLDSDTVKFLESIKTQYLNHLMLSGNFSAQQKKEVPNTAESPALEKIRYDLGESSVKLQQLRNDAKTKRFEKFLKLN